MVSGRLSFPDRVPANNLEFSRIVARLLDELRERFCVQFGYWPNSAILSPRAYAYLSRGLRDNPWEPQSPPGAGQIEYLGMTVHGDAHCPAEEVYVMDDSNFRGLGEIFRSTYGQAIEQEFSSRLEIERQRAESERREAEAMYERLQREYRGRDTRTTYRDLVVRMQYALRDRDDRAFQATRRQLDEMEHVLRREGIRDSDFAEVRREAEDIVRGQARARPPGTTDRFATRSPSDEDINRRLYNAFVEEQQAAAPAPEPELEFRHKKYPRWQDDPEFKRKMREIRNMPRGQAQADITTDATAAVQFFVDEASPQWL